MEGFSARLRKLGLHKTYKQTITNSALYVQFDPNCISIEGNIALGNSLKIRSNLSPKQVSKVKICKLKSKELMVWESGLPF